MKHRPEDDRRQKTIAYSRLVELSHTLCPDIPRWPGDPPVELETLASLETDGYFLRRFSAGEHSGTHINAPAGFYPGGMGVDGYNAAALAAPAVVIDVREEAGANPDYLLTMTELLTWERQHQQVPAGSLVLLFTGWQEKWHSPQDFLGYDEQGALHFPGFGAPALGTLLTQRGAAGIGIDTHGVDGGQDARFTVNRRALEQPRIVLENLTNLDQLPPTGATLFIGRLRLPGGSGSPAMVTALIP